jgi:hypothetical protein
LNRRTRPPGAHGRATRCSRLRSVRHPIPQAATTGDARSGRRRRHRRRTTAHLRTRRRPDHPASVHDRRLGTYLRRGLHAGSLAPHARARAGCAVASARLAPSLRPCRQDHPDYDSRDQGTPNAISRVPRPDHPGILSLANRIHQNTPFSPAVAPPASLDSPSGQPPAFDTPKQVVRNNSIDSTWGSLITLLFSRS